MYHVMPSCYLQDFEPLCNVEMSHNLFIRWLTVLSMMSLAPKSYAETIYGAIFANIRP